MELVFATHNPNKLLEAQLLMPKHISLLSMDDIGCTEEIHETSETLEGNAKLKADFVTERYGMPCFADDTGLLVDALNGAPGVFSARYAGEQKNADDNMHKLLAALINEKNRSAHFKTAIALNLNNESIIFEGVVHGEITTQKFGSEGFGYDPIFRPTAYQETFAQLPVATKNQISHRGKALQKLISKLRTAVF
ncbi:MAG: non-canonical purine NTP diphosphatase [Aurantibacter sp.]